MKLMNWRVQFTSFPWAMDRQTLAVLGASWVSNTASTHGRTCI